jgi:hypothetical protein
MAHYNNSDYDAEYFVVWMEWGSVFHTRIHNLCRERNCSCSFGHVDWHVVTWFAIEENPKMEGWQPFKNALYDEAFMSARAE